MNFIEREFYEVLKTCGWDYKTMGGALNIKLSAAAGSEKAKALLQQEDVKQAVQAMEEFSRDLADAYEQFIDPVDKAVIQRILEYADLGDPVTDGMMEALLARPLAEIRERIHARLQQPLHSLNANGGALLKSGSPPKSLTSDDGRASLLAEIPPHPLKERREKVRRFKLEGLSRKEIAKELRETEDVVKKDLEWLRANKLLAKD